MNLRSEIKSIYFLSFARGVINPVAGLDVVAVDIEVDALPLICQGIRLDADAACDQFAVTEIGGHLVVDATIRQLWAMHSLNGRFHSY